MSRSATAFWSMSRCRRSVPAIYAAGDVTEAPDLFSGPPSATRSSPMRRIRRASPPPTWPACNRPDEGSLAINVLDTMGMISTSFGQWQGVAGGEGVELVDEASFRYLSCSSRTMCWSARRHRLDRPCRRAARADPVPGHDLATGKRNCWRPDALRRSLRHLRSGPEASRMQVTVKLYATLGDYLPAGSKSNRVDVETAERCVGQCGAGTVCAAAPVNPSGAGQWRFRAA